MQFQQHQPPPLPPYYQGYPIQSHGHWWNQLTARVRFTETTDGYGRIYYKKQAFAVESQDVIGLRAAASFLYFTENLTMIGKKLILLFPKIS